MGNEQWAMSNGQWAMGNGQWPASQPASGKSGGQGVDFQLSGRACRRGRSANGVGKRISKPLSATPEATRNRSEIDSKSTPNRPRAPPGRPGGPRARFRTHSRVPAPPRGLQGASGGSQNRPRTTQSSRRGGSRGDLGSASGASGTLGARRAGNSRPVSPPKRPEAAVRSDFGTIFGRFRIDFRTVCRVPSTLQSE